MTENIRTETPGLPSGVSLCDSSDSIPASHPHAITDVAKPQKDWAAFFAQLIFNAVIISLEAFIGNASAKVFSISIIIF